MTQPIGPIEVQAPTPSILTTARDRSRDDFGVSAPVPAGVNLPDGSLPPSTASWRSGIAWTPATCQPSSSWEDCPAPGTVTDEAAATNGPVKSWPFWIYTPLTCEWTTDPAEVDRQVAALTEAHTAYRMGRAIWMGDGLQVTVEQPTLRRSATDVTPAGGAVDLDDAVALLLGAYEENTGGNGGAVLHIPSIEMTAALGGLPGGGRIATLEGNFYRGPLGALVSPGPGYPWGASTEGADGFGPIVANGDGIDPDYAGTEEDELWVYVTGPVEYALGEIIVTSTPPGDISRQNVHETWANRQAIFRFDPCAVWACKALSSVSTGGS